ADAGVVRREVVASLEHTVNVPIRDITIDPTGKTIVLIGHNCYQISAHFQISDNKIEQIGTGNISLYSDNYFWNHGGTVFYVPDYDEGRAYDVFGNPADSPWEGPIPGDGLAPIYLPEPPGKEVRC